MDRHSFHQANWIYNSIEKEEERRAKLWSLKDDIINCLSGHIEIPEQEIFDTFHKIDDLSKYLDKSIEEKYQEIEKL
jgi:hypothetical protein